MIAWDGEGSLKTRAVTEGAMSAVIIVLLGCLDFASGLLDPLIPIPLAVMVYRHGLKAGMAVSFVSAAVVSLVMASPIVGIGVMITGLLGIALGLAVKEKFSLPRVFAIGVGASVLAFVLRVITFSLLSGYSFIEEITVLWERVGQTWLDFLDHQELPQELAVPLKELAANMPAFARMLLPLAVLLYSLIDTVVCLFGLNIALKRFGASLPRIPRFIHWKLPWYFVWGFILDKAMAIILAYFPNQILQIAVLNLDLFFSGAFFVQGLAIMWFYMDQAQISKPLRVLITVLALAAAYSLVFYILTMLGVLDTWFDIRNPNKAGRGGY